MQLLLKYNYNVISEISVYLSVCLSVYLSVYSYLSVYLSTRICLSVCLLACLPASLSSTRICLPVCLSISGSTALLLGLGRHFSLQNLRLNRRKRLLSSTSVTDLNQRYRKKCEMCHQVPHPFVCCICKERSICRR
jgi:hypothetical protein